MLFEEKKLLEELWYCKKCKELISTILGGEHLIHVPCGQCCMRVDLPICGSVKLEETDA